MLILVGIIRDNEGENDRGAIGRSGTEECTLGVVTHSSQDDRDEVASNVCTHRAVRAVIIDAATNGLTVGHRDAHMQEAISPQCPVLEMVDGLFEGNLVGEGITTVLVDSANDKFSLVLGQDGVDVGECGDEKEGDHGQADGDSSLDDL